MRRYVSSRSSGTLRMAAGERRWIRRSNADLVLGWVEQRPQTGKKNTINYHLMRLYPKIKGPTKQGK